MSEYKHTVAKTQQGGFSESPEQGVGNSGNPSLNDNLTLKNGVVLAVAYSQGKKVFNAGFTATIGQIGNSRLEEVISGFQMGIGYIALGVATGGVLVPIVAGLAELATVGISNAVEFHATALDNNRLQATRGTLINLSGVEYYG